MEKFNFDIAIKVSLISLFVLVRLIVVYHVEPKSWGQPSGLSDMLNMS